MPRPMAFDTDQQAPVPPTGEGWPPPPTDEPMPGWPAPPVAEAPAAWPEPEVVADPAVPLPGTFAFGPSSSARAAGRGLRVVVAAVAFAGAAFAGYTVMSGGDEPAPPPAAPVAVKPKAKPVVLTTNPNVVNSMLKNMATAEESYFVDNGTYTAKMSVLQEEGVVLDKRVKASVVRASASGFCLRAAGAGTLVRYYSSKTGKVSRTAC